MAELIIDTESTDGGFVSDVDSAFQNRDFVKWMKRIDKGEEYVATARRILNEVTKVATDTARRICHSEWTAAFPEWPITPALKVESDIKAPVAHKIHNGDDQDDFFVHYREYPFYYLWNVFDVFTAIPLKDEMKRNPEVFNAMFTEKVAGRVQSEIVRFIRKRIGDGYADAFAFPGWKDEIKVNRINIMVSTSMLVSEAHESPSDDAKFRTSEMYRNSVVSELAMALGRIREPIKEVSSNADVKADADSGEGPKEK